MKRLISCEYNFDNCCVELKFSDGSMIAIETIAVENEVARNMYERSELDYGAVPPVTFTEITPVSPSVIVYSLSAGAAERGFAAI